MNVVMAKFGEMKSNLISPSCGYDHMEKNGELFYVSEMWGWLYGEKL